MIYGRKIWGPKAWHLLHTFAMNENKKISNKKKSNYTLAGQTNQYLGKSQDKKPIPHN